MVPAIVATTAITIRTITRATIAPADMVTSGIAVWPPFRLPGGNRSKPAHSAAADVDSEPAAGVYFAA
jgi:hypothetical protein